MTGIDWSEVRYFYPATDDFSEDPDQFADPELIYRLDYFREVLGKPVHVSPAPGAMARFDDDAKTSQHYAVGRKSTAIDVFPEGPIIDAWLVAITGRFGGVGVYFDTMYRGERKPMLHLDKRPRKKGAITLWMRKDGEYIYSRSEIIKELSRDSLDIKAKPTGTALLSLC